MVTSKPSTAAASTSSGVFEDFPNFSPALIDLPGAIETNAAIQDWWTTAKYQLLQLQNVNQQNIESLSVSADATTGTLQAQINTEKTVRADADIALATSITTVSASLTTDINAVAASVTVEAAARATADGFLEGKYTLKVVAGNVVTGMNITSSTGGGSDVSTVIFQANDFLIYNSVTGLQMFAVSGTTVKLGSVLVIDNANSKLYVGAGNYGSSDTAFYVDSGGNMSLKDHLTWNATTNLLTVSGSIILSAAAGPSGSGLFLGSDFLGYYAAGAWKTYMDSSGHFYLGGTSGALQWNGTTLSITGNITISNPTSFGVNYAGAASPGAAATSIVSQGALATQNTADYNSQLTNPPTNSAGLLLVSASPSGSGLFMSGDHLGYYSGGAWKTYMDNSGNFYLGGTGGTLLWNAGAGTLTIQGNATFTGVVDIGSGVARTYVDGSKLTYGYGQTSRIELNNTYAGDPNSQAISIFRAGSELITLSTFSSGSTYSYLLLQGTLGNITYANSYIEFNADSSAMLSNPSSGLIQASGKFACTDLHATGATTLDGAVDLKGTTDTSNNAIFRLGNFKVGCGRSPGAGTLQGYLNLVAEDSTVLNVPFYN